MSDHALPPDDEDVQPLDDEHVLERVMADDSVEAAEPTPLLRDANGRLWRVRRISAGWLAPALDGSALAPMLVLGAALFAIAWLLTGVA